MTSAIVRCSRKAQLVADRHVAGGGGLLDHSPGAVCREGDHGVSRLGAGAAALAGGVRVGRRADRDAPSRRRVPRQGGDAVAPFGDRLGPLVGPAFRPPPHRSPRIVMATIVTTGAICRSASASAWAGLLADRLIVNPAALTAAMIDLLRAATGVSGSTGLCVNAITRLPRFALTSCQQQLCVDRIVGARADRRPARSATASASGSAATLAHRSSHDPPRVPSETPDQKWPRAPQKA